MFKSHIRKENCLRSSNVNGSRMAFPAEPNKQSPFRRIGPKSTRSLLKSHSWTHLFHSTPLTGNRIIYFPEDIKFVCHMINTQLVVEVMVDLVVANEMYEKVDKELEILWWKPKNWTGLKSSFDTCLCVCPQHQKTKNAKKVKKGKTCKVLPVAMFVFANNPMFLSTWWSKWQWVRLLQNGHNTQPWLFFLKGCGSGNPSLLAVGCQGWAGKAFWLPGTGREIRNHIPVLREGNGN